MMSYSTVQGAKRPLDAINPKHYRTGSVECIDAIEASMSTEAFTGYLKGNTMKYLWRYEKKGGKEDLAKATWYLERLQDTLKQIGE